MTGPWILFLIAFFLNKKLPASCDWGHVTTTVIACVTACNNIFVAVANGAWESDNEPLCFNQLKMGNMGLG